MGRASLLAVAAVALFLAANGAALPQAHAEFRCREVRYAFQPDCFSAPCVKPKRKLDDRLDLGPQVAVWVETADHHFVDTLMVTNLVARYGIGNRPGRMDLPSGPKQPYGKRLMALPVWAWTRGKLYPQVVMQDGKEDWMGFHESSSSPDPYFCRPMGLAEVDVDAISCPTKVFNSAKGKMLPDQMIPYPPRNDLDSFTEKDCDSTTRTPDCPKSATQYATLNDLDAVSAPTPGFDKVFEGHWVTGGNVKSTDDLVLMVEVNREFDQNATYKPVAYDDKMLSSSGFTQTGLPNNLGQPSVVYRVPFRIDGGTRFASAPSIAGYGAPDGSSGVLAPPDSTISDGPGSGAGRLKTIAPPWTDAPAGDGRVFVRLDGCGEVSDAELECNPTPAAPGAVSELSIMHSEATSATVSFKHGNDAGQPVQGYEIRLLPGKLATDTNFLEGVPKAIIDPAAPGTTAEFEMTELKPLTEYVIAVRALGRCGTHSVLAQKAFATSDLQFVQLTGCFIATAAYGSPLAEQVNVLRTVRDRARGTSAIGAAAIDAYERSSPPVAALLAGADGARAIVRRLLAPAIDLVRQAEDAAGLFAHGAGVTGATPAAGLGADKK